MPTTCPRPFQHRFLLRSVSFLALLLGLSTFGLAAFVHPGGLHTQADLDRMKSQVAAGAHPWIDDWNLLTQDPLAQNTYVATPLANMGSSRQNADKDAHAAYLNAIRWYISGDTSYADCAVRILNAWAATVNQYPAGNDTPGLIAIPIQNFALAGEVLRIYPGWQAADFAAFKGMFANYCYPVVNDFLTTHNGTGPTHYWANWDACNIGSLIAMGVLCDNQSWFDQGVSYYQSGIGAGAIDNAVVALHPGNLYSGTIGQWQESGRDQSHSQLGLGLLGYACQTAWNQGIDLFSTSSNRFLYGAEYVAQYNLWHDVPFTQYINSDPIICAFVARNLRGRYGDRPVYELLYNHYTVLGGQAAPNVKAMAELQRPEGGSSDHFGYGTLTFTRVASASPYPVLAVPPAPTGLTATASVGAVWLAWIPPAGDIAGGYNVLRATSSGGPYTTISSAGSGVKSVAAIYTDTAVTNGTTYYYVVQSVNQSGVSSNSAEVSALPVGSSALAGGWADADIGTVITAGSASCSAINNNTFIVSGSGNDISGTADALHYVYQSVSGDFTFVGRLGSETLSGSDADKIGLMMRESLDPGSKNVALILYSTSEGKQQLQSRGNTGGSTSSIIGQNYVYAPQWFKLVRTGNTFTGSISIDGTTWVTTGTTTVTMASTYYAGIAVCSRSSSGALTKGVMDNVTSLNALPNPPVITSANSVTTTVGAAFNYQITATASPSSFDATNLPAGLSVSPSTGVISGSTSVSGTFNVGISATNSSGTTTATLTITVNPAVATNGTWNSTGVSPLTLNLTFTASSSTIAYTVATTTPPPASTTPVVGDAIRVNTTVGNFSNGNAYFVVGVNTAAGTIQLGTAPGAAAQVASVAGTSVAPIYMRWSNSVNWTSGTIASGYGAVATIGNLPSNVRIALGGNWIVGTINFTGGGGSDLDISGYDYATSAGGSLTFATGTSATPLFSVARNTTFPVNMVGARTMRVIGSQGLEVMSSVDATFGSAVSWRPQTGIDWSQFSGDLQLRQGRLDVQANNVLPSNSNLVLGNSSTAAGRFAVFSLFSGRSQAFGALSGTAIGRVSAGTSSVATAGTALTLTLGGNNGSGTFAGVIGADAAGSSLNTTPISIVKNGSGTEIFSGANVYTGNTTINAGTFLINGSLVSPVVVNAGIFGGSGSTSNTVTVGTGVGAGAVLSPGNGGIGTFTTTGALTLRSDASLALEFNPSLSTADKVVANGVTLNNAILSPTAIGPAGAISGGATFTIVDNTSASPVSGTFNGLPEGSTVTVGLNQCKISYVGGTGNDITLTVLGSAQPPIISSTSASGVYGSAFTFVIAASNTPTSFSATGLPAGLTLNTSTGVVSGTPLAGGNFAVTVTATNAAGSTTATLTFKIAAVIGVNLRAYNTYGVPVTDVAGVVRAAYWNNLVGPTITGETVSISSLTDNLGNAIPGITATWTAGTTGGSYTNSGTLKFGTDAVTVGPASNDQNLFSSAFDQYDGTPSTLTVTGIPYANYDAIFYVYDGGATQGGTITANGSRLAVRGGIGNPDTSGNGYVQSTDAFNTAGTSVQQGNYVRFTGLSGNLNASFVATNVGSGTQRLKIAGFQILSNDSIAAPTTAPAAPTGLTASAGNTAIGLNWSASATATSYKIYKAGTLLATVPAPLTSYADTAVTNGTSYSYAVATVNSVGEGTKSSSASATPAAPAFTMPPRTVYQYSIPMTPIYGTWSADPQRRAYLWVPPGTTKLQGVIVGLHNMLEKPMFDDPAIRQACADANLGIVFISPGDSKTWIPNGVGNYTAGPVSMCTDLDPNNYKSADINPATGTNYATDMNPATGARFTNQAEQAGYELAAVLTKLAVESGFTELQNAPVMFAGHSAASPWVWTRNVYSSTAMNGRVFGILAYKGTFPGSLPNGIPILHVASEWQEISNWGNTWELGDAPQRRGLRAGGTNRLLSTFVQPGTGHYDYDETQSGPIGTFIRQIAQARIPANWPAATAPTLNTLDPTAGYVVDVTTEGSGHSQPVAYSAWIAAGKDPLRAYWYLDLATAQAICDVQNAGFSKRPQMINGFQNATTLASLATQSNGVGTVSLSATLQSDGVTFKVQAAPMNQSPVSRLFYGAPLGIASGPISFKANGSGGMKQTGADTFRVWLDRGSVIKVGQPWEPFIIARQPGDVAYRSADRPIGVNTSVPVNNITGAAQTITFPAIPDQSVTNLQPITLNATASSGLPVQYWVASGPYRNDEYDSAKLIPAELPVNASYPMRVVVGAWQWGQPGTTAAATAVYQEFFVQGPPPAITSANTLTSTYGSTVNYAITATNHPTSFGATGLPAGLTLDPATGVISGTVNATGNFSIGLVATNAGGSGTATLTLSIAKASATVALGNLSAVYDGSAKVPSVTSSPANLDVTFTYDGSATAPIAAGSYGVIATVADANYSGSATGTLVIAKAPATVALGGLTQTYSGTPISASATTAPVGLAVNITYDGSATPPTNVGSYAVAATIADANYFGSANGTLVVGKAPATVTLGALTQTYNGSAKSVTVSTNPSGLPVSVTYNGNASAPSVAGSYDVVATITSPNYTGSATGTLVITKAAATITLAPLVQRYDGTAKSVTATTLPAGLSVTFTYDGVSAGPIYPGAHTVVATIDDPNYSGSQTETLTITITALVRHAPTMNGMLDGSLQVLSPESVTFNSTASVSGDMLLPGMPNVVLNGQPVYGSTIDANGSATPTSYTVTLNTGSVLRHVVRRVDAISVQTVDAPPAPTGTRDVALANTASTPGDFSTVRNLSLSGSAGIVAVPAGTYGTFSAGGSNGFRLGVNGATEPSVYNLQGLTLNGGATLQVQGPVVINLAAAPVLNGKAGVGSHPEWLTIRVASDSSTLLSDDTTINGNVVLYGTLISPSGTITIGGRAELHGSIIADRLTLNGQALLADPVP